MPVHQVSIRTPFFLGCYVVTQDEWQSAMDSTPWKDQPNVVTGDEYPAVHVSWFDSQDFLNRVSERDRANRYYLPTEEVWVTKVSRLNGGR